MIRVAIIDTYIKPFRKEKKKKFVYHYKIKKNKVIKEKINRRGRIVNHGSICYEILVEYTENLNYSIHCIEVVRNGESKGNITDLITAFEWCLKNDIQIISLSIGSRTIPDRDMLQPIVHKLYESGIIIIAAFNNGNTLTYPAALKTVIGVSVDKNRVLPLNTYVYLENNNNMDIIARIDFSNLENKIGIELGEYNSYVVPFIVALVLRIKLTKLQISSKNIREYLKAYSKRLNIMELLQ